MHNLTQIGSKWSARLLGILAVFLFASSGAALAVTFNLSAKAGSTTLPGGASVPVWGYVDTVANPAVTRPGGPVLIVNQGDSVTVNLTNTLTEASGMLFQGQAIVPDTTGAAAGGGTKSYTFTATKPGTFLYEAALLPNAQHQAAMGLHGALIVRPTGFPAIPGQAYANLATAFDHEAVLVLSELDPALAASPATFDMRDYAPKYFLINGKAYPNTDPIALPFPLVPATDHKVLLRYVNAGVQVHSMGLLGLRQTIVAKGGNMIFMGNYNVAAETVAPGQTADGIATVAATTADGSKFAVFDGTLMLHNNNNNYAATGMGGMLTFVAVGTAGAGTAGPVTSGVALVPNPTTGSVNVALTATVTAAASPPGLTVAAAEYFIDAPGANGAGVAMTGTFGGSTASVSGTITVATLAGLSSGKHNIYVHGRDSAGTWGGVNIAVLTLDKTGPATTGVTMTPNPTNGTVDVALSASGDDRAAGNSNVTAAAYTIDDGGAAVAMTAGTVGPVTGFTATIAAATVNALAAGPHNIAVRSQDALGNWGLPTIGVLQVTTAGPVTSGLAILPSSANNGAYALSIGQPVIRITAAAAASAGSTVSGAEGFIDPVGTPAATVRGFPFLPTDGVFNGATESAFADVPLTTVNSLAPGNHTILVRSKDSAGNWGNFASIVLLIDKTAPTLSSISLALVPAAGITTSVNLTVNGTDPLVSGLASGIAGGEYWIDSAAPAIGGGTPFTGLVASIPVGALSGGNHTFGARIRDAAGNWSTGTSSATILFDTIFTNGFETAGNPWGWSSTSTNNTTRLNRSAASALVGSFGLQAQGNQANYVQFDFGTAANPSSATYDAQFYFNPHGNTGNNQDILVARTSGGTTVFRVRYRWNGGSPQVQIQVGTGTANALWTGIINGVSNRIQVAWQSGGTLSLFVGGAVVANQTLTATANSIGQVRLGSVTGGGSNILEYFDGFSSKRSVTPLLGP